MAAKSPKRADKRARVAQQYFPHAGEVDAVGQLLDLEAPQLEYSSMLATLRRTRFSHERVKDLIQIVKQVDGEKKRKFKLAKNEIPAPREAQVERVSTQDYADAIELDAEMLASCTCMDDEGNIKVNDVERKRLATIARVPLSWCVAELPTNRHMQLAKSDAVERVLFAEVRMPQAAMSRMALTSWLEVVPSSYDREALRCGDMEKPARQELESDEKKLDALMNGVWVDTNFRGVRSLFDKINMLYLGIGIADVKAFVRKQELKQMRAPRVESVTAPLVPTALGWHQIDIMYATWDRGITSKEDRALEKVAEAQEGDVLINGQKLRYKAALQDERNRQRELQREQKDLRAQKEATARERRALETTGFGNVFFLEDLESLPLSSLRLNTLIDPKQKTRNPKLQLEVLGHWTGAKFDNEDDMKDTWAVYGWIPLVQAYLTPFEEKYRITVERDDAKQAAALEAYLLKNTKKQTELVQRYEKARLQQRMAEQSFAYDWGSISRKEGEPKHTPLSPAQQQQYFEELNRWDSLDFDIQDLESQVDKSVQTMNLVQAKLDTLQTVSPVEDSDPETSEDFLAENKGKGRKLAGGAGEDEEEEVKRRPLLTHPYVLNIMDIFSKYAWSFPLRDQEGRTVAKILNDLWLKEGAPLKLQSDGGFGSNELGHVASRFGVKLEVCAPYKSQCSGAIERLNRTIRESIRNMLHAYKSSMNGAKWIHYLPNIVAAYNAQKHSTTQLSPFHVQRGFEPRALRPQFYAGTEGAKPALLKVEVCERRAEDDLELEPDEEQEELLEGGGSCRLTNLHGGVTQSEKLEAEGKIQARTLDMAAKVTQAVFQASGPPAKALGEFMQVSKAAAEKRTEFVQRGIRHGALTMTVDALIKAESSMKPLKVGQLVRVSLAYMDRVVRKEIKVGMKRAQDLKVWSSTVYVVDKEPLQFWLGSEDAPPSSQSQRSLRPLRATDPRFKNFYTVFPCLPSAEEPRETHVRFVPRQDLLLVSETLLSEASRRSAKAGKDQERVREELDRLVALRESLPPLQTF